MLNVDINWFIAHTFISLIYSLPYLSTDLGDIRHLIVLILGSFKGWDDVVFLLSWLVFRCNGHFWIWFRFGFEKDLLFLRQYVLDESRHVFSSIYP